METLRPKVGSGFLQCYRLDDIDAESLHCTPEHPAERIGRHLQYERYLLEEVLPLTQGLNPHPYLIAAECNMGAWPNIPST